MRTCGAVERLAEDRGSTDLGRLSKETIATLDPNVDSAFAVGQKCSGYTDFTAFASSEHILVTGETLADSRYAANAPRGFNAVHSSSD